MSISGRHTDVGIWFGREVKRLVNENLNGYAQATSMLLRSIRLDDLMVPGRGEGQGSIFLWMHREIGDSRPK